MKTKIHFWFFASCMDNRRFMVDVDDYPFKPHINETVTIPIHPQRDLVRLIQGVVRGVVHYPFPCNDLIELDVNVEICDSNFTTAFDFLSKLKEERRDFMENWKVFTKSV